MLEIRVAEDAEQAARLAAEELTAAGGHIALAGGATPRRAYEIASALRDEWSGAELWWGDERCVEPGDPLSNYRLVRASLLDRIGRLPVVHRIRGELGPEEAAAAYDEEIRGVRLDLAFLGLGPDGHTASLFPGSPALEERERAAVAAEPGLEPFVPRVTLTIPVLSAAPLVIFLATGSAKAEAVRRAFGSEEPDVPAGLVRSREGRTVVVLDREAAGNLQS